MDGVHFSYFVSLLPRMHIKWMFHTFRITMHDETVHQNWNSPGSQKYLNMILVEHAIYVKYLDAKVESMHVDVHSLIDKLKQNSS